MLRLNAQVNPVIIVGGGPAGLMAADVVARAGYSVALFDAMPSVGRKFLLAGVGGMNITHAEPHAKLVTRYGATASWLKPYLDAFPASDLRAWIHGLGIETFVGSSGRVFPADMKAAPLLRAWLQRLRELGVVFYPRHRWLGWNTQGEVVFQTVENNQTVTRAYPAQVVVLALGGASWQRLGSNGAWVPMLREKNIQVLDLVPANCGFDSAWSPYLQQHFAGAPLATIGLRTQDATNEPVVVRGEAIITKAGIEGTSVYALSAHLRDAIARHGHAWLYIDLLPDVSAKKIVEQLNKPRGKNSTSNFLRKQLHLPPVKLALLRELTDAAVWQDTERLAQTIKALPVQLLACRPLDEAISSGGGIGHQELTPSLMLRRLPGVFCAGEMLDWEAPTGGYLLTACFATGRAAGQGVVDFLAASL